METRPRTPGTSAFAPGQDGELTHSRFDRAPAAADALGPWALPVVSELRSHLHRYWFRFDGDAQVLCSGARLGLGVTAVDRSDAEHLIGATVFGDTPLPARVVVVEDIDVPDLDREHVLSNMGDPSVRGVWFPRL